MLIASRLVELYHARGIDICTGLNAHDFGNLPTAPFTRFIRNGCNMTSALGIALQEIYLLEHLFASYRPRNVLIIGNSLGWSTLAIALLLPDSKVVALDAGFDEIGRAGLDLTNRLAAAAGLDKVRAVKGVSPQDVAAIVNAELDGRIDFAFIDGLHTNEQIVLDFEAVARKAATDAIYLFHDVHLFNMYEGIGRIEGLAGRAVQRLRATPSGMAILYDPARHPQVASAVAPFAPPPEMLAVVERDAWWRRHPYLGRWQRSFTKRLNFLRRIIGASPLPVPAKGG